MELICKDGIKKEVDVLKERAAKAENNLRILSDEAEGYAKIVFKILNKRGIKVGTTQMYFNSDYVSGETEVRAMVHIVFEKPIGVYDGTRARNLEKAIREAGIPCPINNFNREVKITLSVAPTQG